MRQLTSLDAQFLAIESPRTVGHVSGLAILTRRRRRPARSTWRTCAGWSASGCRSCRRCAGSSSTCPLGLDYPSWIEDPHFDLDFHVRDLALPPGAGDDKLAEQVARIVARPLDRSRPLWELYLIHGLPDGRVAMLTKIHHAVVDGVSGAEILTALLDPSPEGRDVPPAGAVAGRARAERGRDARPRHREPPAAAAAGAAGRAGDAALSARAAGHPGPPRPRDRQPRRAAHRPRPPARRPRVPDRAGADHAVQRADLAAPALRLRPALARRGQGIKNAYGFTVNDVVVSISAGAVRRWLMERDALPAEPLLAMIRCRCASPEQSRHVRQPRVGHGRSDRAPTRPTRAGACSARTKLLTAKDRHRALPADLLTDVTRFIPPAVAARAARTTLSVLAGRRPPLNLIISNVPGPRVPLFCAGARLEAHYPVSVIADGVGLNITVMSYLDHLDFGIVADREMVPDVWSMIEGLREELDELSQLTPRFWKAPAPRRSARRRPPRSTSPAGSPPADRS